MVKDISVKIKKAVIFLFFSIGLFIGIGVGYFTHWSNSILKGSYLYTFNSPKIIMRCDKGKVIYPRVDVYLTKDLIKLSSIGWQCINKETNTVHEIKVEVKGSRFSR